MKIFSLLLAVTMILAGCAATDPRPGVATGTVHTGEVWTWDEKAGTITLRQGTQIVRIKAAPDQFRGLELHQTRTIRGEVAPPADLVTVVPPPAAFAPAGPAEQLEVGGTVASVAPAGTMTVTTDRGPVVVWVAQPGSSTFKPGDAVRVKIQVQPLAPAAAGQPATVSPDPSASPTSEPGEYATVQGAVLSVGPAGQLSVQSPRGPVTVAVGNPGRYQTGQRVEVRTSVHAAAR